MVSSFVFGHNASTWEALWPAALEHVALKLLIVLHLGHFKESCPFLNTPLASNLLHWPHLISFVCTYKTLWLRPISAISFFVPCTWAKGQRIEPKASNAFGGRGLCGCIARWGRVLPPPATSKITLLIFQKTILAS